MKQHFISLKYLSQKRIDSLLALACKVKKNPQHFSQALQGKTVGLLFEKPSLRTKASFDVGATQLGAHALYFGPDEVKLGKREAISDVAKTLSRYIHCVVLRTFSQNLIVNFARDATIPVVNGLSDLIHPSQVLGDIFTLNELRGDLKKIQCVYMGDGNNVCHSLIYAFSILGGNLRVVTPSVYQPRKEILREATQFAKKSGATITLLNDPLRGAKGADVLYTDVWVSMGEEKEQKKRLAIFKPYQVNKRIVNCAKKGCLIMHCLPAHRGEEITDSVLDSKNSIVFQQAENRLHAAKAILLSLLGGIQ